MRRCVILLMAIVSSLANGGEPTRTGPRLLEASDLSVAIDPEALQAQYEALSRMPSVTVRYSTRGPVTLVEGHTGIVVPDAVRHLGPGDDAGWILARLKDALLGTGTETLTVLANQQHGNYRNLDFEQSIAGRPVVRGKIGVEIDESTGLITAFGGDFLPDRNLPSNPKLSAKEAERRLIEALEATATAGVGTVQIVRPSTLAYYGVLPDSTRGQLVWSIVVRYKDAEGAIRDEVAWVDAIDGSMVGRLESSQSVSREIYNVAGYAADTPIIASYPGSLPTALTSAQISANPTASQVLANTISAQTAWTDLFQTQPPNAGIVINYTFGAGPNAKHTVIGGVDYMTFHGSTATTKPYSDSLDVVAHEYGHGVSYRMWTPWYGDHADAQPAALGEGFSDLSAILVESWPRALTPGPTTWVMGEVYKSSASKGIRSVSNPKEDPNGGYTQDWFPRRKLGAAKDTAHTNSTIMTHAYYLLSQGGFHARAGKVAAVGKEIIPSIFVSGLGQLKAHNIFVRAFQRPSFDSVGQQTFENLRDEAASVAETIYATFERDQVVRAFQAIGLDFQCSSPPAVPQLVVENEYCFGKYQLSWTPVSGATGYHVQRTLVQYGWAFAQTVTDGDLNSCSTQVGAPTYVRMRACNGCGCSAWSPQQYMYYQNVCW